MSLFTKKNLLVILLPFWILLGWALSDGNAKVYSAMEVFSGALVLTSVATFFYHQPYSTDKATGKKFKTKSGDTIEEFEEVYSPGKEMDDITKKIITVQFIVGIIIFFIVQ